MKNEMEQQGVQTDLIFNTFFKLPQRFTSGKSILNKLLKSSGLSFSILFRFRKLLSTDVIFSHAILFPTFYAVLLKFIHRKPVICYVHGGDLNTFSKTKGILKRFLMFSLNKSDQVICNSEDIEKKVLNLGIPQNKVCVIPPGVDLSKMHHSQQKNELKEKSQLQGKFVALTIGNAIKRKGHYQLLENLIILINSTKIPIHLILVTEGKEVENYKHFIQSNKLENYVTLKKYVTQDKLVELYNTADVFILPSLEEPLGLVALEAMACGLPVVGTNVGGLKTMLSEGSGFLFEPDNFEGFQEQIEAIYAESYDKEALGNAMSKKVKKYALRSNVDKMIKILAKQIDITSQN